MIANGLLLPDGTAVRELTLNDLANHGKHLSDKTCSDIVNRNVSVLLERFLKQKWDVIDTDAKYAKFVSAFIEKGLRLTPGNVWALLSGLFPEHMNKSLICGQYAARFLGYVASTKTKQTPKSACAFVHAIGVLTPDGWNCVSSCTKERVPDIYMQPFACYYSGNPGNDEWAPRTVLAVTSWWEQNLNKIPSETWLDGLDLDCCVCNSRIHVRHHNAFCVTCRQMLHVGCWAGLTKRQECPKCHSSGDAGLKIRDATHPRAGCTCVICRIVT
jgi:hypothetical protein